MHDPKYLLPWDPGATGSFQNPSGCGSCFGRLWVTKALFLLQILPLQLLISRIERLPAVETNIPFMVAEILLPYMRPDFSSPYYPILHQSSIVFMSFFIQLSVPTMTHQSHNPTQTLNIRMASGVALTGASSLSPGVSSSLRAQGCGL